MTEPFIGEIQIYGFSFAPYQWAFAAGQTIAVQQNTALFSLIGAIYGGNGTTTFQLPNLASRQACSTGQGPGLTPRRIGDQFGNFNVSLTSAEMPPHNHGMNIYLPSDPETVVPAPDSAIGKVETGSFSVYAPPGNPTAAFDPQFVQSAGGNLPHTNVQPYLALNFSIALSGQFPSFG